MLLLFPPPYVYPQTLSVLELFAGASGTGFLAQSNAKVNLELRWANDMNQSAAATYTANHPDAWVSALGGGRRAGGEGGGGGG